MKAELERLAEECRALDSGKPGDWTFTRGDITEKLIALAARCDQPGEEYAETVAAPLREQVRCWQAVAEGEAVLRQLASEEIADLKRERDAAKFRADQAEKLMDAWRLAAHEAVRERDEARASRDFYQRRCDMLQAEQRRMRDPERTLVCDILANGQLLPDPHGKRYGAIDSAMGDKPTTVAEDVAKFRAITNNIEGKT